jgi:predicted enzyme related to lactoylglutathione lyase
MINGIHALIYSKDADNARAFFRDILKLSSVDIGHGWLIFALPPAELAVHPAAGEPHHEIYLMCDDIEATMKGLTSKGAVFTGPPKEERWGLATAIKMPGGSELGIYQPKHPTALGLGSKTSGSTRRKTRVRKPKAGTPRKKSARRRKR